MTKTQSFSGFDRFAISLHGVEGLVLKRKPCLGDWNLIRQSQDEIVLQRGVCGAPHLFEGEGEARWLSIFLPMDEAGGYWFNGQAITGNVLSLIVPDMPLIVRVNETSQWGALSMTEKFLRNELGDRVVNKLILQGMTGMLQQLKPSSRKSMSHCSSLFHKDCEADVRRWDDAMLSLLADVARGSVPMRPQAMSGRSRLPRRHIIHSLLVKLAEESWVPSRVDWLADKAGVSERTLRSMFHDIFGLAPGEYLRSRQLNLLRRGLCTPLPEERLVSAVAVRLGIGETKRLFSYYRALFGEAPFETLCRHFR